MTYYELLLFLLVVGFEAALCWLVYARHLQKRLPMFAVYAATILISNILSGLVFWHFGFRTPISYYASWAVIGLAILTRTSAIVELSQHRLQAYRGIWRVAWRILVVMALFFVVHGALDAWGQPNWIGAYALTIERDIEVASLIILLTMLVIGDYYDLPIDALEKWIAVGFCFFCAVEVVNSTVLRDIFSKYFFLHASMGPQIERVNQLWNTIQVSASLVCFSIWGYALRKPLPEPAASPALLPDGVYQTLSPAVNLRMRELNNRLLEMLKP